MELILFCFFIYLFSSLVFFFVCFHSEINEGNRSEAHYHLYLIFFFISKQKNVLKKGETSSIEEVYNGYKKTQKNTKKKRE